MKFESGMICFLIIDGELCKVRPLFNVSSQAPSWHAKIWDEKDNINSNSINSQAVTLSKLVAAFPWMGCCSGLPDHPGEKAISTSSGRPVEVETADGVQKVLIAPASYCYCLLISSAATFVPEIWKDSGWLSVATHVFWVPFFFFCEFFEGKRMLLKDKNDWFHLMPRLMSAPKMPFPRTISLEPGLCSLDQNLMWKRIPDGARNEALSLNISFQPFEVGWVLMNFRATVLYFDTGKLVQTVGFQTSEVQTQDPVAFLLPFEGFLFRILHKSAWFVAMSGHVTQKMLPQWRTSTVFHAVPWGETLWRMCV